MASLSGVYFVLFSYKVRQSGMQGLAAKAAVDDFTLRVDKDIVGDAVNLIDGGCGTFPAFQVADLQPRHLQLSDGLDPSSLFLVERDTDDLEALVVEIVVSLDDVRHLSTAGPVNANLPLATTVLSIAFSVNRSIR